HGADLHEPAHARAFGRVGEQHCRVAVDGLLARGATARPRARGEHGRVGSLENGCDLVDGRVLQIEHGGFGAHRAQVVDVVGVPDDADGLITVRGKPLLEQEGDLSMSTGDDNTHVDETTQRRAAPQVGRWWETGGPTQRRSATCCAARAARSGGARRWAYACWAVSSAGSAPASSAAMSRS